MDLPATPKTLFKSLELLETMHWNSLKPQKLPKSHWNSLKPTKLPENPGALWNLWYFLQLCGSTPSNPWNSLKSLEVWETPQNYLTPMEFAKTSETYLNPLKLPETSCIFWSWNPWNFLNPHVLLEVETPKTSWNLMYLLKLKSLKLHETPWNLLNLLNFLNRLILDTQVTIGSLKNPKTPL